MTDLTVFDGLVRHRVLSEILTNHVGLDFNGSPVFARVNFSNTSDHLGHDDSVTEVGLDSLGLLTVRGVLDAGLDLLDKSIVLGVDTMSVTTTLAGLEHGNNLFELHLEELVDLDTSVLNHKIII